jgi:hypothetical protein
MITRVALVSSVLGFAFLLVGSAGLAQSGYACKQPYTPCGYYNCYPNPPGSGLCVMQETFIGGQCLMQAGTCSNVNHQCVISTYRAKPVGGGQYICTCEGTPTTSNGAFVTYCPNPS